MPTAAGDGALNSPVVGVLAVQGDVAEHVKVLTGLGARVVRVIHAAQLNELDGIVLPGGESTTIGKLTQRYGIADPLRKRLDEGLPALGTCAGAILLARAALHHDGTPSPQPGFGVLDVVARRNAFGRQVASFETEVVVAGLSGAPFAAAFIRAPWFEDCGAEVEILAEVDTPRGAKVVVVRQGKVLACAFHPELTGDGRLHGLFLQSLATSGE